MKFLGPTTNGTAWSDTSEITVVFETVEELQKANDKYFPAKRAVVRTSGEARPGEGKTLNFQLPGGLSFKVNAKVEKVKERPGMDFVVSLFKLTDFAKPHQDIIAKAIKGDEEEAVEEDELMLGFDDSLGFGDRGTVSSAPAASKSPSKNKKMSQMFLDEAPVEFIDDAELPPELDGVGGDLMIPSEDRENDTSIEMKKWVIAFVLKFTKSVARAGYYADANHPEAKKAKEGLYSLYRRLLGDRRQVTFIKKSVGDDRDMMIDGPLDEMLGLVDIMPQGMRELYVPRFMEYFDRRCLISMTIRRSITKAKFEKFIDLMGRFSTEFKEDTRKEGERFTQTLVENDIIEVSTVFDEDIISSGRKLPWQAELTLSRLRKDLKTVPLLKDCTEDEMRVLKERIFTDTVKPLRNPVFLIVVLLNSDLIMEGIEDMAFLNDLDVEMFIILGVEIGFLAKSTFDIINELEGVRKIQQKAQIEAQRKIAQDHEKILARAITHIADRFLTSGDPVTFEALEELYNRKMVAFKVLPVQLQDRITGRKLLEAFLNNTDQILLQFNSRLSDKDFSDFLSRFQRVIPLLAAEKKYDLVANIIDAVRKHLEGRDSRRRSLAKRLFDYVSATDTLKDLIGVFEEIDDKEIRNSITAVYVSFGRNGVPFLLNILKNHGDKWVRKQMIRALIEVGEPAVQPMVTELYKEKNEWYFLRNLVNILGELGDRRVVGKLNLLLFHDHPQVREETLLALHNIAGEMAEPQIVKALDDKDPKVMLKAVYCLGASKSTNERALKFYSEVLGDKIEDSSEMLKIQVYRAIAGLSDLDETRKNKFEDILTSNLEQQYKSGFMALFIKKKESAMSDSIKMAIVDAMGGIGRSKKTRNLLQVVTREKDPILKQRSEAALAKVKQRLAR